ncbi:putative tRNA pseudouridine synthase Pus10 [Teleopsis dalmanni]|uniref:putative tRNA pseudouridine synthase Pus10 n=1 Tax=Teleopsis dalmanni TaxID=139649 RepID=UPI0018CE5E50|nr:putative tRNA pseudouridine synthase Pus10 [Teleopsis dalmanni]
MSNQDLVNYLTECGVCQMCQLRYLKSRGNEYQDIKQSFKNLDLKYSDIICNNDDELPKKKQRSNVCTTCLGLFSKEFQEKLIAAILKQGLEEHECSSIVVAISTPIILQVRQLSMWFALRQKFEHINTERPPDVPLKEAIKLIINPILCEKLHKNYDVNGIMISVTLMHNQNSEEISNLEKLNKHLYREKHENQQMSRVWIEKHYTPGIVDVDLYKKFITVPPPIPNDSLYITSISVTGPTVYIAGRYRKLSRKLSHTPWLLNGIRVMEDSVEEIIIRSIVPHFCAEQSKIIFMSSGREDVDVRCLGKGRPFVLEIPNAHRTKLIKKDAFMMESNIEKSLQISVRDLQTAMREETVHIKTGEEKKHKFYRALCKLEEPVTIDVLEKLNLPEGFLIDQKTPLRVLHRRPLLTRPRRIHSLRARVCQNNLKAVILDVVTQAGTYVKELVHGDFGRTSPSITSIIGKPIDIISLDVIAVGLEWPAEVDNSLIND